MERRREERKTHLEDIESRVGKRRFEQWSVRAKWKYLNSRDYHPDNFEDKVYDEIVLQYGKFLSNLPLDEKL